MLDENSYMTAMYVYIGAASLALLCLLWWLRRRWRAGWLALFLLVSAALLLTPAYPQPGVSTMAPALVVAAFQILTDGVEAAAHALKPLAAMVIVAVILALLLRLTLLKPRRVDQSEPGHESETEA